jgi:hypothetical protein
MTYTPPRYPAAPRVFIPKARPALIEDEITRQEPFARQAAFCFLVVALVAAIATALHVFGAF